MISERYMKKKFLFVNLSIECGCVGVNHGIAHLVPVVKKYSYNVTCLNIQKEISKGEFRRKIEDFAPSVIGFSCTENQLKYLIKYSGELTRYPEILQIAGGTAPTLDPDWILRKTGIKGVCIGEGEVPVANLLNNIDKGKDIINTEGFYWCLNGNVKKNRIPEFTSDLSVLDFPDYSVFENNLVSYDGNLNIMLSRGCPYNCYHCCNKALSNVYPSSKKYFRLPSVNHSISLIERTIKQYPETKFIGFEDDLLIADKTWFKDFTEKYSKKINLPYRICVRAECVDQSIVETMKNSGCMQASLGLESGNENLRKNLLNRHHKNGLLIEKCKMIKAAGIDLFTFNIVGFPGETGKEMQDTFDLNREIAPNSGACLFFYPYRGTELYNICKRKNLLKGANEMLEITNYCTKPSIEMTIRQKKDCMYFHKKLSRFFAKQRYLFSLVQLPSGIQSCPAVLYLWARSILQTRPLLTRTVSLLSRFFGIRAFMMYLIKSKPR